jgi:hypothetical protein
MAEGEDTATARYIASNVSTQLMLKILFEVIATMADDPDSYRSSMRKKLVELADTMPLAPTAAEREKKVRAFAQGDGRQSVDQSAAELNWLRRRSFMLSDVGRARVKGRTAKAKVKPTQSKAG